MKKFTTFLLLAFFANYSFAQIPTGYYDGTAGSTGYALKTKLHAIIKAGHQDKGYGGLWEAYKIGDLDKYYENDNTILDVYSEKPLSTDAYNYIPGTNQCGGSTPGSEGGCYNREHVFPQGFFNEGTPMKHDYLHVFPTDNVVNGKRGNFPFGKVGSASWTSTNGSKLGTSNFPGYGGTVFEPIDEFKGDIARSLLYFITRYEDQLSGFSHTDNNNPQDGTSGRGFDQWYINLLMLWHQNDPVSAKEIARNNYAYVYQKNRNPYIDHPEWVTEIWTSTLSTTDLASFEKTLSVYPNPVRNGELNVSGYGLNEVKTLQIYSIDGKLIQTVNQDLKNNRKIILKNITKGNYILKAENQSVKFIVQ